MKVGDLLIDESEIVESFVRSSGPGGQNVDRNARGRTALRPAAEPVPRQRNRDCRNSRKCNTFPRIPAIPISLARDRLRRWSKRSSTARVPVDVLPSGAGGAHEAFDDLALVDEEIADFHGGPRRSGLSTQIN